MKKIIWLFGEPGSGRKTLINKIKEDKDNVRELFKIDSNNIDFLEVYQNTTKETYDPFTSTRSKTISKRAKEFTYSENDVLIIIGQFADINNSFNNSLINIAQEYPNLEKEIYFLNPKNQDLLYERLKDTNWFKSDENNKYKYPREWLKISVDFLRKELFSLEEQGYKVIEVDTTEGYEFDRTPIKNK